MTEGVQAGLAPSAPPPPAVSTPPTPASTSTERRPFGSRFVFLEDEEESVEATREVAEEVAWLGLGLAPDVPRVACSPEMSRAEVEEDFWMKIGFPTVESRAWTRSASPKVCVFFVQGCGARKVGVTTTDIKGQRLRIKGSVIVAGWIAAVSDATDQTVEGPSPSPSRHASSHLW
jgi:hypothetical protein